MTSLEHQKSFGAFYTPESVAEFLVKWAIRKKSDIVMDPGTGEGVFMKKSEEHLVQLGANQRHVKNRIFGIEYDSLAFKLLKEKFKEYAVINSNFFSVLPAENPDYEKTLPFVDAVVGNPPYIERERMKGVESIRKNLMSNHVIKTKLHLVTDIYGYFLIHSTSFLKEGGKLAFIISDSWLNMDFGVALKEFLLSQYKIKAIVSFEERVFSNALVRAVLLLAEKGKATKEDTIQFITLKSHSELDKLTPLLEDKPLKNSSIKIKNLKQSEMNPVDSWGVYLKASDTYFEIISKSLIVPLKNIANVGIGLQSLKNEFYIIDEDDLESHGIEKQFLDKVIVSSRGCPLVIDNKKIIHDYVIYCNKDLKEIKNTNLSRYIKNAEKTEVTQRGKNKKIIGYQNVPRINQARRDPWYNLIPEIEKRCRSSIILPRRSFTRFFASWNKARVVVNDNFINIEPKNPSHLIPLLAILNSSFTEYMCRARSQTYGGGVFDLRPDDVKSLPCLNVNLLTKETLEKLTKAYLRFVENDGIDKTEIDVIVLKGILNLRRDSVEKVTKEKEALKLLATVSSGKSQ